MADFSEINDFLNDDSFVDWVLKGTDDHYWQLFKNAHPEQTETLIQAQQLILTLHTAEDVHFPADPQKTWSRIQQALEENTPHDPSVGKPGRNLKRFIPAASVFILILITGTLWYFDAWQKDSYPGFLQEKITRKTIIEKVNDNAGSLEVHLPDGSTVTLHAHSRISYPADFDSLQREVYLMGEAFFNVKKDRTRPFYVYAGDLVTKVLGTSFNIRAIENDTKVVVNVKSGSVSVFPQKKVSKQNAETSSLILLPNQEVIYNRVDVSLNKKLTADPLPLETASDNLLVNYEEVPVSRLFQILGQVYGVNILFSQEDLSSCIITTNLNGQSLFESLEIICTTIGATFKVIDAQIVIESGGCASQP